MQTETIRRLTIQYSSVGADGVKKQLDEMIAAQRAAGGAADGASKSVLSLEKQVRSLERVYDPAIRAQQDLDRATRTVTAALAQGSISAERATNLIGRLNARLIDTAASQMHSARQTSLNAYEMTNLGYQLNDLVTMLASGSSPFQAMATQGGQVYQILSSSQGGVGGALKDLGARFMGLVGPAGLATAAVAGIAVAGFAAWSSFDDKVQQTIVSLNGAGRASGMTVDSLMAVSSRGATRANISTASGLQLGGGFAAAGLQGGTTEELISSARQFSRAFGLDLQEAGKELAAAFSDPVRGAEELNKRFGFLSGNLQTQIQRQQEAGNLEGARNTLLEAYNRALADTTARTNVLSSAFEWLKRQASNGWNATGRAANAMFDPTLQQQIDSLSNERSQLTQPQGWYRGNRNPLRVAEIDNELGALQERQLLEAGQAAIAAFDVVANSLSTKATEVARSLLDGESSSSLVSRRDRLQSAVGDPEVLRRMGISADQAREALARAQTAVDNFRTPLQRLVQDGNLAVAAASAFTASQRATIDAERARIETLRSTNSETQAGVAAANAYRLAIAESSRVLRDAARSANDNATLAGMTPFQRAMRQIDFDMRDLRERTVSAPAGAAGASPVAAAATQLASGFNAIFADKIGQLQAQFPELRMTSGVRTEEEQRTLRALYGPNGAAAPGNSRHEVGLAADFSGRNLTPEQRSAVIAAAQGMGLTVIPSNNGAMHVEGPRSWANGAGAAAGGAREGAANLGSIESARRAAVVTEYWDQALKEANREVEKQDRLLQRQIQTFGMSTEAIVTAAKAEELRLQFERQGVPLTAERIQQIDQLAASYGRVAQSAENAQRSQQRTVQTLDAFREAGSSAFSGVANALIQGKSASEALEQALNRLISRLLDMAGNQLMEILLGRSGTGGGGLLGNAVGGLFGGGQIGMGGIYGGLYDVGGVVGAGGGRPGGLLPASLWNGAPQFAKGGGVGPGARPIIAHDGEIILNSAMQRRTADTIRSAALLSATVAANSNRAASGGGAANVVVNNYSNSKVTTRENRGPNGQRALEIMVEGMVASSMAQGEGRRVLERQYGLSGVRGSR